MNIAIIKSYPIAINALRNYWIAYDPIGVMDDPEWPRDEYDNYLTDTLSLLQQTASKDDILIYLKNASEHMGIEFEIGPATKLVDEIMVWYRRYSE